MKIELQLPDSVSEGPVDAILQGQWKGFLR